MSNGGSGKVVVVTEVLVETRSKWVKLGWRKCMVGKPMRKWWWLLMKKQPSLSSQNTLGDSNHYSSNH